MVHLKGLEPLNLKALDPKSSVSANSTTGAYFGEGEEIRTLDSLLKRQVLYLLSYTFILFNDRTFIERILSSSLDNSFIGLFK